MRFSIVTVCYNSSHWVYEFIKSVINAIKVCDSCFSAEIVIIDNHSNYSEFLKLKSIEESINNQDNVTVRVYRLNKNYGYSGAVNIGVRLAKGDIVAVSNPDIILEKDFFKKLYNIYEYLNKEFARRTILVPKVLFWNRCLINSTGLTMHIAGYGVLYDLGKKCYNKESSRVKLVLAPHGAFFIAYRDTLIELGPFDPLYFSFLEDLDLGLRAYARGYYVLYIPVLTVRHHWGSIWGRKLSKTKYYYTERNRLLTLLKDIPLESLSLLFPNILVSEAISLAYAVFNGYFSAKMRIYSDLLKNLDNILKQRRKLIEKEYHIRLRVYHLLFNFLTTEFTHTVFDLKHVYILNKLYNLTARLTGIVYKIAGIKIQSWKRNL